MPTTLTDLLSTKEMQSIIMTKLAESEGHFVETLGIASSSPIACFRQVSRACLSITKQTESLRLKSLTPFVHDMEASKEAVCNLLKEYTQLLKLRLYIKSNSEEPILDLSIPFSCLPEALPKLKTLELEQHGPNYNQAISLPGSLLPAFNLLEHFTAHDITFLDKLSFSGSMHTLSFQNIDQPDNNEHLETAMLDAAALDQLTSLNIQGWHGLVSLKFEGIGAPMQLGLHDCADLKNVTRLGESADRIIDLDVSGCPCLKEISQLFGHHMACLRLNALDRLKLPAFEICTGLQSLHVFECPKMKGTIDMRDKMHLESLHIEDCSGISAAWVSGCDVITRCHIESCQCISGMDFSDTGVQGVSLVKNHSLQRIYTHNTKNLQKLVINDCECCQILDLSGQASLEILVLDQCDQLRSIIFDHKCINLREVDIHHCRNLLEDIDMTGLSNIRKVSVINCEKVTSVKIGVTKHPLQFNIKRNS